MEWVEYIKYSASPKFGVRVGGWWRLCGKVGYGGGDRYSSWSEIIRKWRMGPGRALTILASSQGLVELSCYHSSIYNLPYNSIL